MLLMAVVFALVLCGMIAGALYLVDRLSQLLRLT